MLIPSPDLIYQLPIATKEHYIKGVQRLLWQRGDIDFILRPVQKEMKNFFLSSTSRLVLFNCSRQLGKSLTTLAIAISECIKHPDYHVVYVAPTAKQAKEILTDKLQVLLKTCPIDLRPKVNRMDGDVTFKNGSRISLYGVDHDEGRRARGNTAHLVILDECAFMKNLSFLVKNVFSPFLRQTGGRMLMASTPPHTIAHDFTDYVAQAKSTNGYIVKTILQSGLPLKEIKAAIREHSIINQDTGKIIVWGSKRASFRIEYMCEVITDQEQLVIPEWIHVKHMCVQNYERPTWFKPVVVADWGFKDHTGILFGYVNFREKLLIIEDEILVNNMPPSDIAILLKKKLKDLWPNKSYEEIRFIADDDLQVTSEIYKQIKIRFISAVKHNAAGSLNNLRTGIGRQQIRINTACGNLMRQLEGGIWDINKDGVRKDYKRSEQLGHLDLIDSLKYFYRMAEFDINPEPVEARRKSVQTHHLPEDYEGNLTNKQQMRDAFGIRR